MTDGPADLLFGLSVATLFAAILKLLLFLGSHDDDHWPRSKDLADVGATENGGRKRRRFAMDSYFDGMSWGQNMNEVSLRPS